MSIPKALKKIKALQLRQVNKFISPTQLLVLYAFLPIMIKQEKKTKISKHKNLKHSLKDILKFIVKSYNQLKKEFSLKTKSQNLQKFYNVMVRYPPLECRTNKGKNYTKNLSQQYLKNAFETIIQKLNRIKESPQQSIYISCLNILKTFLTFNQMQNKMIPLMRQKIQIAKIIFDKLSLVISKIAQQNRQRIQRKQRVKQQYKKINQNEQLPIIIKLLREVNDQQIKQIQCRQQQLTELYKKQKINKIIVYCVIQKLNSLRTSHMSQRCKSTLLAAQLGPLIKQQYHNVKRQQNQNIENDQQQQQSFQSSQSQVQQTEQKLSELNSQIKSILFEDIDQIKTHSNEDISDSEQQQQLKKLIKILQILFGKESNFSSTRETSYGSSSIYTEKNQNNLIQNIDSLSHPKLTMMQHQYMELDQTFWEVCGKQYQSNHLQDKDEGKNQKFNEQISDYQQKLNNYQRSNQSIQSFIQITFKFVGYTPIWLRYKIGGSLQQNAIIPIRFVAEKQIIEKISRQYQNYVLSMKFKQKTNLILTQIMNQNADLIARNQQITDIQFLTCQNSFKQIEKQFKTYPQQCKLIKFFQSQCEPLKIKQNIQKVNLESKKLEISISLQDSYIHQPKLQISKQDRLKIS